MIFTATAVSSAAADQCAWIEPQIAEAGAKQLLKAKTYVEYCAPCKGKGGPPKPSAPKQASVVTTRAVGDEGLREVVVDGTALDLAYVYIKDGAHYTNVAELAGCPTRRVPKTITLK